MGEFEVDGAEALQQSDEAVGVAAAEGEVTAAKGSPGWGKGEVEFFVANAAEELGVGGGTASGDSAEGAALAEEATEIEDRSGVEGDIRFVHSDSDAGEAGHFLPA